jgi:hypothetical protein
MKLAGNIKALAPYIAVRLRNQPIDVESKLVLILSFPRSGTHALGSLLSKKEVGFQYYGEFFIFNAWHSNIEKLNYYYPFFSFRYHLGLKAQRAKWKYDKFKKSSLNAHKTLRSIKKLPGVHVIKIFPRHLSDPLLEPLISEFKPHIIFLRRNHLDRFVSHKKANATGKWHTSITDEIEISLNPVEFENFIESYTAFYKKYRRFSEEQGCAILDLNFSDLHTPEKVREIHEFASLPGFTEWEKLHQAPTTIKQDKSSKIQDQFLSTIGKHHSDFDFDILNP